MPGMPEVMAKPDMLAKLDDLFKSPTRRAAFINDIRTNPDLYQIAIAHNIAASYVEQWHLREHWFRTWWPTAQGYPGGVKETMHKGFKLLADKVEAAPTKHVDFLWVCDPGHGHGHTDGSTNGHHEPDGEFEVSISVSHVQITFILQTPHPPIDAPAGSVKEPVWVVKRDGNGNVTTVQASHRPNPFDHMKPPPPPGQQAVAGATPAVP
jgi:hypothetical protein